MQYNVKYGMVPTRLDVEALLVLPQYNICKGVFSTVGSFVGMALGSIPRAPDYPGMQSKNTDYVV